MWVRPALDALALEEVHLANPVVAQTLLRVDPAAASLQLDLRATAASMQLVVHLRDPASLEGRSDLATATWGDRSGG